MNSRPRMSAPEVNGRHLKRPSGAASRSSYGAGFALDETRPLACFAGIWTNWTSVWKVNAGRGRDMDDGSADEALKLQRAAAHIPYRIFSSPLA